MACVCGATMRAAFCASTGHRRCPPSTRSCGSAAFARKNDARLAKGPSAPCNACACVLARERAEKVLRVRGHARGQTWERRSTKVCDPQSVQPRLLLHDRLQPQQSPASRTHPPAAGLHAQSLAWCCMPVRALCMCPRECATACVRFCVCARVVDGGWWCRGRGAT